MEESFVTYRIYYQEGTYEYRNSNDRWKSDNYEDYFQFLEADTIEELKVKIDEFLKEHAELYAACAVRNARSTSTSNDVEHSILRFVSPIVLVNEENTEGHYNEEFLSKEFENHYETTFNELLNKKFSEENKRSELEKALREQKQREREENPDYQKYLALKKQFEH